MVIDPKRDIFKTTSPVYLESNICRLTAEDYDFIRLHGNAQKYKHNEVIIYSDTIIDKLLFIIKGYVRCSIINSQGLEKILHYNDMFIALESFFHEQPCAYQAIAMDDVELLVVERNKSDTVLSRKNIRDAFLKALSLRCRILGWQLNGAIISKPLCKVSRIICSYYSLERDKQKIKLTHQEIASLAGLHRVTVTNSLKSLKKMGVIDTDSREGIKIKDWPKLSRIGFDSRY
ncbi:MAG TPA: Crp/Fnr family transcriptional regulator [Firmicutes bacterium]|nr:Crp/Fnr family transcriptional regulator [Bacillota bacterium]